MPNKTVSKIPIVLVLGTALIASLAWRSYSADPISELEGMEDTIAISHLEPDRKGGRAYMLVYWVKAPVDVYWRFKTDFDNDFLVTNDYIKAHRFVSQSGQTVITEDQYANRPDISFRWQTTMAPDSYQLDFVLLNPEQCGQKFHYGRIRLEPVNEGTRVTQVAYFDFWGVSLWAYYPWKGGMQDFLSTTARWEQAMVQQLKQRYVGKPSQ
jgi:hypothetical protein